VAIQTIYALKSLHELNVMHRDMKSANILLTQENGVEVVKLGDLNVSKVPTADGFNYT
jgi:NIMA (never in mitosis gene a)-related kinase 1/4/5